MLEETDQFLLELSNRFSWVGVTSCKTGNGDVGHPT